ncbi:MAG: Lrp/AsnC family transcriptional regulator [Caldilineae bacterium]|nr:MAG: Lrp/AsnC family transcriptional regulator [Caldilineae bacterium]
MDELDLAIIGELQRDGRKPFTEIAKKVGVSEGTVRNRVTRLIEEQILQVVGMVDPYQLGYDAPAIIGVAIEGADMDEVGAQIATFPEVSYLVMVSGEYDFMVEVMCRDREHLATFLNQKLRKVPGVYRTHTFLILGTYKMALGAKPTHPDLHRVVSEQGMTPR